MSDSPRTKSTADRPFHLNFLWRAYDAFATGVDHKLGWDHLPKLTGTLRPGRHPQRAARAQPARHLPPAVGRRRRGTRVGPEKFEKQRTVDGSWNDLANPTMGMAGTRFGRNVPIEHTWPDTGALLEPNPRTVSRRLMTRDELIPATAGNALIAAWLQFMIRDWFKHGTSPTEDPWTLELDPDDDWPEPPLLVHRTPPDPTTPPGQRPARRRTSTSNTHWWDGSQIYGNSAAEQDVPARARGRPAAAGRRAIRPIPDDPAHNPTLMPGFWLGLGMMQTLFVHEHNSVARCSRSAYPDWDDERLFQRARVINCRAARQDPHHRVDPGGDRPPDGGRGPARQLVRPRRAEARPRPRPGRPRRDPHRHPRHRDRPLRRAVRADRGVRRGLPDAPADPRPASTSAPPPTTAATLGPRRVRADHRPGRRRRAARARTSATCSTPSAR